MKSKRINVDEIGTILGAPEVKKIEKIYDIVITPEDIVARLVGYEDGTGSI